MRQKGMRIEHDIPLGNAIKSGKKLSWLFVLMAITAILPASLVQIHNFRPFDPYSP